MRQFPVLVREQARVVMTVVVALLVQAPMALMMFPVVPVTPLAVQLGWREQPPMPL